MAIFVDERTRVVIQNATGRQGRFHLTQMLAYGTHVMAGTSPGKGGQEVEGIPIYDTVEQAVLHHAVNASVIFVPAAFAKDAVFEAADAGLGVIVVITEHIPVHDAMAMMAYARQRGSVVVGPNTFGIISPGKAKLGIMPAVAYTPGPVGIVARSGTLSYEIASALTDAGLGQTTVVGLGGDRVVGLNFVEVLKKFSDDPETRAVVLVGEIGGSAEEEASEYIKGMSKPVVAYVAGRSAPPGKRMGHAGAIIERGRGTFEGKIEALEAAGVKVAALPWQVADLVAEVLPPTPADGGGNGRNGRAGTGGEA
ncbi:MAG: succinate--CoA ligase subunit alpha [Bacillota bacterium]|nr:MAG: succinate--CoA ligase subunit alpha [Bacillota bacterium]